jgi:hypothetical protein
MKAAYGFLMTQSPLMGITTIMVLGEWRFPMDITESTGYSEPRKMTKKHISFMEMGIIV